VISEPLPPLDFGRIAAQSAKQVIVQKVREAERDRQYEEFKDRIGEDRQRHRQARRIWQCDRRSRPWRRHVRRDETDPARIFKYGDRSAPMSRRAPRTARTADLPVAHASEFMAKLFTMEVPEIYDGVIEIKRVARDPGSRAKIGVISNDSSIDPVGACVGMRGSRVQAVVTNCRARRSTSFPGRRTPATFIVNALQPAEVAKVVLDEDAPAH
jgi:N utilization substance protein A